MLVVVEDRNVELLAQPGLDLEAARGRDVLEVDAAEGGSDELHGLDDLLRVLGVEADGKGIHSGQLLEEHGLALHHRHRRLGADVAEPEHRGAVGDDGHRILLDGEREGALRVFLDRHAHAGHTGRVGHGEIVARPDRHLAAHLDLATEMHEEGAIRDVGDLDAGQTAEAVDDALAVLAVPRLDGDVAEDTIARHLDQVHRADITAGLADDHGDAPQHPGAVQDRQADRETVGGARCNGHQLDSPKPAAIGGFFTIGPFFRSCQSNSRVRGRAPCLTDAARPCYPRPCAWPPPESPGWQLPGLDPARQPPRWLTG